MKWKLFFLTTQPDMTPVFWTKEFESIEDALVVASKTTTRLDGPNGERYNREQIESLCRERGLRDRQVAGVTEANDLDLTNAIRGIVETFSRWEQARGAQRRDLGRQLISDLERALRLAEVAGTAPT
jgi:hypothetical protein